MAKGFAASDGGAGFPTGLLSIVSPSVTFGNGFGKFIATFAKHVESGIASQFVVLPLVGFTDVSHHIFTWFTFCHLISNNSLCE
jgi:hypothetical protein